MQFTRYIPLLLTLSCSACYAASSTYDGKPGCKTPNEIGHAYKHFWDPMRYWRCIGLGMEPLQESCPDVTAFQQSLGRCVPWRNWNWAIPVYPPSCPTGVMCIQTETKPSSLQAQELNPQAPPQALVPTSPLYAQLQPSTQPHIVGPLPSFSPQPLLPSESYQILHPTIPAQPFVSSQSPQTLNTSYPLNSPGPQYPAGPMV